MIFNQKIKLIIYFGCSKFKQENTLAETRLDLADELQEQRKAPHTGLLLKYDFLSRGWFHNILFYLYRNN